MNRPLLPLIIVCLLGPLASAGTLVTRDGQTLAGDLALSADAIKVTPKDGAARSVSLKNVASADFAAPVDTAPHPAAQHVVKPPPEAPRKFFTEYFADADMTDRRLARYEPILRTYWNVKTPPDPAIPPRPHLRITFRIMPLVTEDHAFNVDCYGPVRLWVDGKLVLDKWVGKKANQASAVVPLVAKQPVTIRLDAGPGETIYLVGMNWSSRSGGGRAMSPELILPADDAPAPAVTARLAGDVAHFRAPPAITVDATVEHKAKIARVDLVAGNLLLASATAAPYKIVWKDPAPGVYKVRAQAVDEHGVSSYSPPIDVSVAGTGDDHSLPAPWGSLTLGKKDTLIPGQTTYADKTFTLTKAGGQITEGDDAPHLVYQPVVGDFQLVVRITALAPQDNLVGAMAGVMVREGMTSLDRFFAAVVAPGSTTLVRRAEYWGLITTGERLESAAKWLKIVRLDNRLRAYTSPDGVAWSSLGGADRIALPERVYVGLCAMARSRETPAVAKFDHVTLTAGSPALAHRVEGILFRNGSFLAAEVAGVKGGKIAYTRRGERKYMADSDAARLIYKSVPAELADKAPKDQTGVLLASGDFLDGDIKDITYLVTVSNILFGPRTINIKANDVLAIHLKDAEPPSLPYVITATDGSIYQSKTIRVTDQSVTLEDPTLGEIDLPLKDLATLKAN